jgi:16S rRNA (cytidine1402-2'-O)-methyltransferase
VLKEVDIIAAEDTRRTRQLLAHYQIKGPHVTSYHDHNKERKTPLLIRQLLSGQSVAVVSDAGTPGISDPAYFLVKHALENQIPTTPIPGVSAPMAALVVSGLPTDRFVFEGFLPARKSRRRKRLQELNQENRTVLLFESPHRILQLLTDAYQILGDREVYRALQR